MSPAAKGAVTAAGYLAFMGLAIGYAWVCSRIGDATYPWVGWAVALGGFALAMGLLTWRTEKSKQQRLRREDRSTS